MGNKNYHESVSLSSKNVGWKSINQLSTNQVKEKIDDEIVFGRMTHFFASKPTMW